MWTCLQAGGFSLSGALKFAYIKPLLFGNFHWRISLSEQGLTLYFPQEHERLPESVKEFCDTKINV